MIRCDPRASIGGRELGCSGAPVLSEVCFVSGLGLLVLVGLSRAFPFPNRSRRNRTVVAVASSSSRAAEQPAMARRGLERTLRPSLHSPHRKNS